MRKLTLLTLVFVMVSCSMMKRSPSSIYADRLSGLLAEISETFEREDLTLNQCKDRSKEIFKELWELDFKSSQLAGLDRKGLEELVEGSFETRLNIRKYIKRLEASFENENCINGVRNLTVALRYLEDYAIGQLYHGKKVRKRNALTGRGAYFLRNPKYQFSSWKNLKSGDIIISRGNAYTSAAIAKIGNADSQFSHMSFVYKDKKGRLYTTEAHIEIGSTALPFKYHLAQGNARAVVFRFKDQKLAHRAAKHMFLKVSRYSKRRKRNINYDFGMNYKSNKDLFCSEVIYDGFSQVTDGEMDLPQYKTTFDIRLIKFLRQIGINVTNKSIGNFDTFAPGDIEFDNRFDLVAEWRDPNKITNLRVKDVILTKMYHWMMEQNYKFRPGIKVGLKTYAGWVARRIPWVKKSFIKKFPLNMKPKQLKLFLTLDIVGEALEKHIKKKKDYHKLSFKEMGSYLESFRYRDQKYKRRRYKYSKFHKYFRP